MCVMYVGGVAWTTGGDTERFDVDSMSSGVTKSSSNPRLARVRP